eukprot:2510373-Pyramimonas_sp.AAC.1
MKPEVDRQSVAIELETKLEAARGSSLHDLTTEARGPTSSPPDRDDFPSPSPVHRRGSQSDYSKGSDCGALPS